jgi:hypothetical protein
VKVVDETSAREAADILIERKETLARAITERLYEVRPELGERYGERGRAKCLEDMHYNLEHLAPAVALRSPTMFAGYARWLGDLLRSRGIPIAETALSLELTRETLDGVLSAAHASAVRPCLEAGLAALDDGADPGATG